MKIWSSEHVFNYPWQSVIQGQFRKYPNPHNPSVIGMDVIHRHVSHGVLHSHRIVTSKCWFPSWVLGLVGGDGSGHAYEYSTVELDNKVMEMKTRNLSLSHVLTMVETIKYTPHPRDPAKTVMNQQTEVSVRGLPLCNYLEDIIVNTALSNASKGRQAIDWIVGKISSECGNIQTEMAKVVHSVEDSLGRFGSECDSIQSGVTSRMKSSVEGSLEEMQKDLKKIGSMARPPTVNAQESSSGPST